MSSLWDMNVFFARKDVDAANSFPWRLQTACNKHIVWCLCCLIQLTAVLTGSCLLAHLGLVRSGLGNAALQSVSAVPWLWIQSHRVGQAQAAWHRLQPLQWTAGQSQRPGLLQEQLGPQLQQLAPAEPRTEFLTGCCGNCLMLRVNVKVTDIEVEQSTIHGLHT